MRSLRNAYTGSCRMCGAVGKLKVAFIQEVGQAWRWASAAELQAMQTLIGSIEKRIMVQHRLSGEQAA